MHKQYTFSAPVKHTTLLVCECVAQVHDQAVLTFRTV